jgi:hypothetical protein
MTTIRALYYRAVTYQESVAFTRRKDVWTCKRLAAKVEYFGLDWQVLRKENRAQLEIGASEVDTQKCALGDGVVKEKKYERTEENQMADRR